MNRAGAGAVALATTFLLTASPVAASESPGETRRVSVASDGSEANAASEVPVTSGDGRYVVFDSHASNLVPDDTNDASDVFVHDRMTGSTRRASETADGIGGASSSFSGSISGDGRYVVFYSFSKNLVADDTNGRTDVFRKDLHTGAIELVSIGAQGDGANGSSILSKGATPLSHDGRFVAYASLATNVVPGTVMPERGNHIYLRDMKSGTNELISQSTDGVPGEFTSQTPSVSGDGNVVIFESRSVFDPRDENRVMDVWARNRTTGETEWVSTNNHWHSSYDSSWRGRPSFDGRYVVFDSSAVNLVPRDQGGISPDVFVRDLVADRTEKVSVSSTGAPPNGVAYRGSISGDARFVSFWSDATNLDGGKTLPTGDVYVRDRLLGTTELVSRAAGGGFGNSTSQVPAISADGESVSFLSSASNLVEGDTNQVNDVFAVSLGPAVGFVDGIRAVVDEEAVRVTGTARSTGAAVSAAQDAAGDVAPSEARAVVGDIIDAAAFYRSARNDLLFRVEFEDLPTPSYEGEDGSWVRPGIAAPGATYGVSFEVGGVRYEIRMNSAEDGVRYPAFDLFRCAPVCIPAGETPGSYGTTGDFIGLTVPLEAIGAAAGDPVTNVRAFASVGTSQSGGPPLDEVTLPGFELPSLLTSLGIAPVGTSADDVEFSEVASGQILDETLSLTDLPAGDHEVWARRCLGAICGSARAPFTIDEGEAPLQETTMSLTMSKHRGDVVAEATILDRDGNPVQDLLVTFTLNGGTAASEMTLGDGTASTSFHRNAIKKGDVVEASFAGDETYGPSNASAVMTARNF